MSEVLNHKISELFESNKWQEIIDLLKPVVDGGDRTIEYLRNLGFAYSQLDQYKNARRYYQLWLDLDPRRPQPYYSIGYTYYDAKNWEKAIKWFDKALYRFPGYVVCLYRKGVALFMWGKETEAKRVLQSAITYHQAIKDEDMQRRLAKYYYRSVFYLGKCELALGNYGSARACFQKNMEDKRAYVKPVFAEYNLALCYVKEKKYEAAENHLKNIAQSFSRTEWIFRLWGLLLHDKGHYDEAIEKYTQALQIRNQAYILINRAQAYRKNGDLENAKQDFYEALQRDRKGKHKILLQLAEIALEQNQLSKAEMLAKRAIDFKLKIYEADYANAHYLLHKIYEQMGEDEKSIEELQAAQKLLEEWEWEKREFRIETDGNEQEAIDEALFRL